MLAAYVVRQFSWELFYSASHGLLIPDPTPYVPMEYRWNLLRDLLQSPAATWAIPLIHGIYLVSLTLMILGRLPRLASVAAFILHISFIHANVGAVYGVDLIFSFFLFFFCISSGRAAKGDGVRSWLGSMALRFGQIQVCVIYAFSGWEKLKGAAWWNGDALWSVLANPQMARFDFTWMSHFPLMLVGVAYLTLVWEIYFPVLIWVPRMRVPTLILGVLFHLSIFGMMKIAFFALVMIATYVLFLNERELNWISVRLKALPLGKKWVEQLS
jgi:hypothetical protein